MYRLLLVQGKQERKKHNEQKERMDEREKQAKEEREREEMVRELKATNEERAAACYKNMASFSFLLSC